MLIHVTAEQAAAVPYGLFAQIVQSACMQDAALAEYLPQPIAAAVSDGDADPVALAALLGKQAAPELEQCWRALCTQRSAVVLIDDLARADVPSIQACLGSSDVAKHWPLLLVTTIGLAASGLERDVAQLLSTSRMIELQALCARETAQLVGSLFGDGAALGPLISWIYRATLGVPGPCVELARHALERGYVRFVDGQFHVSSDVEAGRVALPRALDKSVTSALDALAAPAREALAVLSLLTPFASLTAAEQTELAITRELPGRGLEQFSVAALRGSEGELQGLALLLADGAAGAQIRTDGLCTIVADVLVQLRK